MLKILSTGDKFKLKKNAGYWSKEELYSSMITPNHSCINNTKKISRTFFNKFHSKELFPSGIKKRDGKKLQNNGQYF